MLCFVFDGAEREGWNNTPRELVVQFLGAGVPHSLEISGQCAVLAVYTTHHWARDKTVWRPLALYPPLQPATARAGAARALIVPLDDTCPFVSPVFKIVFAQATFVRHLTLSTCAIV